MAITGPSPIFLSLAKWNETNALDPFQLDFRPHHGMEMAFVALFDDLLREANRGKMSLLVLLDSHL